MIGLSRYRRFALASVSLVPLFAYGGCTCGSGPYQGDYFDGDRPASMKGYRLVESEKLDPVLAGCADGQREGFADLKQNPRIAGCMGKWKDGKSLRDAPTGKPCGDDGDECAVPADVCAPGWHVCGASGKSDDLKTRTTQQACNSAGPGRFNAGMSHSPTDELDPCPRVTRSTELPCVQAGIGSEPVCCGNDCLFGKCRDAVWKGETRISRGTTEGCGAMTSDRNGGVMCCFDGDEPPVANADKGEAAETEGEHNGETSLDGAELASEKAPSAAGEGATPPPEKSKPAKPAKPAKP